MGGPGASNLPQVPLSPALKEEYDLLQKRLVQVLFQQGGAEHALPSLVPQGPSKIKAIVSLSVMTAREILLQVKAPLQLALPFARDVAAHIMQIGEQVKQIQYSDQEQTAIFGATYEGILRAFGVKKSQFQSIAGVLPRSQFAQHAQNYMQAHKHSIAAAAANEQPAQGPTAAAGPQGPQGAPQAQGAGMLAQGAAQQPQQGGGEGEETQGEES